MGSRSRLFTVKHISEIRSKSSLFQLTDIFDRVKWPAITSIAWNEAPVFITICIDSSVSLFEIVIDKHRFTVAQLLESIHLGIGITYDQPNHLIRICVCSRQFF